MAYEKTSSKVKPFKIEALRYPSPRSCTSCAKRDRELWAIWWIKPQKPADSPKDLYCFKCYHDKVDSGPDSDMLFFAHK